MSIDIDREQVETLGQAARRLPSSREGRRVHASTLYRWSKRGLKGVRLEIIKIGGTTCTSREALQRFFDHLAPNPGPGPTQPSTKPGKVERSQTDVERRLKAIGL